MDVATILESISDIRIYTLSSDFVYYHHSKTSFRVPRTRATRSNRAAAPPSAALDNGVGLTPAAGWSSWNVFAGGVTAADVMGMADVMVEHGLDKLGYTYVGIDCGWNLCTRAAVLRPASSTSCATSSPAEKTPSRNAPK